MRTVIRVSSRDSAKAWALLVRHSPGVALPDRVFVVSEEAVCALRKAGVRFSESKTELVQEEILVVEKDVETLCTLSAWRRNKKNAVLRFLLASPSRGEIGLGACLRFAVYALLANDQSVQAWAIGAQCSFDPIPMA